MCVQEQEQLHCLKQSVYFIVSLVITFQLYHYKHLCIFTLLQIHTRFIVNLSTYKVRIVTSDGIEDLGSLKPGKK